jgi:hypothetical protein
MKSNRIKCVVNVLLVLLLIVQARGVFAACLDNVCEPWNDICEFYPPPCQFTGVEIGTPQNCCCTYLLHAGEYRCCQLTCEYYECDPETCPSEIYRSGASPADSGKECHLPTGQCLTGA